MSASALYEGWVRHRRLEPVEHSFRYPIFMAYLDLDELPEVLDPLPGWSARRPALAHVPALRPSRRPGTAARGGGPRRASRPRPGRGPPGPIRMLTNLRYFGHCFNPVSFFFCFDEAARRVEAVLADVNNTPWGETPRLRDRGRSNGAGG